MAAYSTWKGYLKLSLVSIPIRAYSTNSSENSPIRLHQLHAECKSRIKHRKVCPVHGEVSSDQIVSGYEYAKNEYVIIDPAELSKLRSEDQKAITVQEFIQPDALDPIYWNGVTLFLMPDGPIGQRPYALLRQGMADQKRYAIARLVWHGKEEVALIRPMGELLAMCMLSYDHQINKPTMLEPELVKVDAAPEERKLVETLIDSFTPKKFDFSKYTDVYTAKLTELIEAKVAGKEIVAPPAEEQAHVINLMDALKQSVEKLKQGKEEAEPPPILAPSKKGRTQQRKKKSS